MIYVKLQFHIRFKKLWYALDDIERILKGENPFKVIFLNYKQELEKNSLNENRKNLSLYIFFY
jgi:hypothetical protein